MNLQWLDPAQCTPPHAVTHPDKLYDLAERFAENGWGTGQDALVGYPLDGAVQLLSGTHRHGAAVLAGLGTIPVVVKPLAEVRDAFGDLEKWADVMSTVLIFEVK